MNAGKEKVDGQKSELIKELSLQKEKLDLYLKKHTVQKFAASYQEIAETEDEASDRLLSRLANDVQERCTKYLEATDSQLRKDITYLFGPEVRRPSILKSIHNEITELNKNASLSSWPIVKERLFTNVRLQQFCASCSRMLDCCTTGTMKHYSNYVRSHSLRKSVLSFTTRRKGVWVRVFVTAPCTGCCDKYDVDQMLIETVPRINSLNSSDLLDDPTQFVESFLWTWIDEHMGK